jgi:hypothetical protein
MLNWAKNDNSFIQYEDGDYHNGDGKLDGDNDKIIFNVCLFKFVNFFVFLFVRFRRKYKTGKTRKLGE